MTQTKAPGGREGRQDGEGGRRDGEQTRMRFRGLVNHIRAEAQNLQGLLQETIGSEAGFVSEASADHGENGSPSGHVHGDLFEHSSKSIEQRIKALDGLRDENPEMYERCGDEIARLEFSWQRARAAWPRAGLDAPKVREQANEAFRSLDEIVLRGGLVTVPSRVNQELDDLNVGQTLDFRKAFEDELPNADHRERLLGHLAAHPLLIEGVIDTQSGLIYRASPKGWRRWLSLFGPLVLVLAVGMIYAMWRSGALDGGILLGDFTSPETVSYLGLYLAVFAGGLAHLAVSTVKDLRNTEDSSLLIINDWLLWAHVREGDIFKKVLFLWIGLAGLTFYAPQDQVASWAAAFFVGYSIDSFVDIFMQRFGQTISTRVSETEQAITGKSDPRQVRQGGANGVA